MNAQKSLGSLALVVGIMVIFGSCKDFGEQFVRLLTASTFSINLAPGGTSQVTISGGNPPYTISRQPDPTLASASITNLANRTGQLTITAPATVSIGGTTEVRVKDSDSHDSSLDGPTHDEREIVITIVVSASTPTGVSFSGEIQPIFNANCTSSCHPGSGPFSLRLGESHGSLVNVPAVAGPCAGIPRVKPFAADSSALYKRLMGSTCGSQMPRGGAPLPDSLRNKVRNWINEGAHDN